MCQPQSWSSCNSTVLFSGSTLYKIFEAQAWIGLVVSFLAVWIHRFANACCGAQCQDAAVTWCMPGGAGGRISVIQHIVSVRATRHS